MSNLHDILQTYVGNGSVPGAVGLMARGDRVEVAAAGSADVGGTSPMARDSIFRVASITKPITAAAVMMLVEDRRIALEDPVRQWLPELASPAVVRTPASPVDDVVPAVRPITVADLLTSRAGYGFPSDFSLPAVGLLFSELKQGPPQPQLVAAPDEWMAALFRIPLLHQPGEAWLYNTCSDILGVLIARAAGQPFETFLRERIFEPLGMRDTGFAVPASDLGRFGPCYWTNPATGARQVYDTREGQWSRPPAFPSGGAGLVSTVVDYLAFAEMLRAGGTHRGERILSRPSIEAMTTDHLADLGPGPDPSGALGWGFGVGVQRRRTGPARSVGTYGWDGGLGSQWANDPAEDLIGILMTNQSWTSPTPPLVCNDFWACAYAAIDD